MKKIIYILALFIGANMMAQDLSLATCKEMALENNRQLTAAKLNLEAAKKVKDNAYTKYFPKVDASLFAMRSSDYLLDIDVPEMNLPVYDGNPENLASVTEFAYFPGMSIQTLDYTNTASVTIAQPVYVGGQIKTGNKLADLGIDIAEKQLDLSQDQVLMKTEDYYWKMVALNEKKVTIESYEKLLQRLKKEVGDFYDAGMINKSDLLKVELELNKIKTNKIKLNNGVDVLKMVFKQHLGMPYDKSISVNDSIISIKSPEMYFVEPELALQNRKEYYMLNKAVEAEELMKNLEKGKLLPMFAVGVSGLYLDAFDTQESYGFAFASLSIPISDWWGGKHKLKEKDIKIKIAKNNLKDKSELLQVQITKGYRDLIDAYKQIDIAKKSVKQAQENEKENKDNYEAGLSSISDLLEAKAILQQAKDALIDAKSQYKINVANYLLVTGKVN